MLGKHHSVETKQHLSKVHRERCPQTFTKEQLQAMSDRMHDRHAAGLFSSIRTYSRARRGRRADLGRIFFRSMWEANYARYLKFLKKKGLIRSWKYEPQTFWFEKTRRGVRSYLPDFRVTELNGSVYYVEVKGWMDAKSKTKLKRMAKYYPDVDLHLVDARAYREIDRKMGGAIPGWERRNAA